MLKNSVEHDANDKTVTNADTKALTKDEQKIIKQRFKSLL